MRRLDRPSALFVGLAAVDMKDAVDEHLRRNQRISVAEQLITAGGPATNAAATFAFLGGKAALVSAVGEHPLALVVRDDLAHFRIRLHDRAAGRREPPPVSSIMVHRATGERSVVSERSGVLAGKRSVQFPMSAVGRVDSAGRRAVHAIVYRRRDAAQEREIPVVVDCGSWKPGMAKLLPLVDTVICSGDFRPPGCKSEKDVFDFLASRNIRRIAITRGESPTRFVHESKRGEIAMRKVRCIDTLGAGDIFHGAYCYDATQSGATFKEALRAAARVATFSCRYRGTRSWMREFKG